MTTAVVYYSHHHGNTKKLLEALPGDVTLIDAENPGQTDLSQFDRVGLASGIYGGSFDRRVLSFAQAHLPAGKPVFLAATAAMKLNSHFSAVRKVCQEKGCPVLGAYLCQGYNTFGPFKLVGGTGKGHPTQEETDAFAAFYQSLPSA